MIKAFWFFFLECWKLNWKFPFFLMINEIILASIYVANAMLPKFIIEALFIQKSKILSILWIVTVISVVFILTLLRNFLYGIEFVQRNKTLQLYSLKFTDNLVKIKYEELEKQSFLDKKIKAMQFISASGEDFATVLRNGFSIFGQFLALASFAGIIFTLSPIVVLSLVIVVFLQSFFLDKYLKPIKTYYLEKSILERRRMYFDEKLNDFQYGKEIRNYNLGDWFLDKYKIQLTEIFSFYKKIGFANWKSGCISAFAMLFQLIIAYYYLFRKTFTSSLTVADFSMYLASITAFFNILTVIIRYIIDIQHFKILFKSYKDYISIPIDQNFSNMKPPIPASFDIEFQNVSFKYGTSEKFALQNVNVKFNSKERIAIIGENGAGKSTFVKLLMRLYEPTEGKILINGIDIKEIDYNHYQTWFAAVFQDFRLFSFSIKENITFGNDKTDADKKRLENIVSASGLKEVTDKLDKGLETLVYRDFDDAGFTPSGGEGQKIAIARAAYKNAPIVILDEPTAALDPKAENKIYEQFDEFFKDKCSIYISHRMAVTKFSDRTLVFDNAHIVQDGKHEVLLAQQGKYKELYELQAKYYN